MTFRRWRRKVRCMVKYGPRGCPHIERHTRRRKRPRRSETAAPLTPVERPAPAQAAREEQRPVTGGRHALPQR